MPSSTPASARVGGWLVARGIGPGDVVAVLMKNSAAFLELVFATSHIGAVFLPINYRLSADEVGYIVGNSGARILIADEELAGIAAGDAPVVLLDEAAQSTATRLAPDIAPCPDAHPPAARPDAADVHVGHDRSPQGRDAHLREHLLEVGRPDAGARTERRYAIAGGRSALSCRRARSARHRRALARRHAFVEELAEKGLAEPLPEIPPLATHPLNERLRPVPADLDEILTKYDLSPHPSLVLVLEGTSEMEVVPKAMRSLDIPNRDSFIRLVNRGGITKQLELLARYIVPSLRRFGGDSAERLRPPTRLMVVTDAEPPLTTPAARARLRADLARHVWNALDVAFRTQASFDDIKNLIDVVTWTPRRNSTFEFAHFTDLQIAKSIVDTGRAPAGVDVYSLAKTIDGLRQGGGNLKSTWKNWPSPKPDKPLIWQHLWPVLERRMQSLNPASRRRIPLVRVLELARTKASGPRSNLLLRV